MFLVCVCVKTDYACHVKCGGSICKCDVGMKSPNIFRCTLGVMSNNYITVFGLSNGKYIGLKNLTDEEVRISGPIAF